MDGVTGAMGDRFGDFGAPEVVALKRFSRLYWKVTKQATSAHEKANSSRNSRLW